MRVFFVNGVRSGEELEFSIPEITVGRELDNTLELPVEGVSRYHAKFVRDESGAWMVADNNSTNGVKVNSRQIVQKQLLREGDLVEFGDQMVRVTELGSPAPKITFSEILEKVDATPGGDSAGAPGEPGQIVFTPVGETGTIPDVEEIAAAFDKKKKPAAASAPEQPRKDTMNEWSDLLKKGGDKLFSGKGPEKKDGAPGAKSSPLKRILNMIFYLALFAIVICGVKLFLRDKKPAAAQDAPVEQVKPFVMTYGKELVSADNIFRFSMTVENDTVRFSIDDVKSDRKYETQPKKISEEMLAALREDVEKSGFFKLAKQEKGGMVNNQYTSLRLLVIDGDRRNEVEIFNTAVPRSFQEVEDAINSLTDSYGLQTISLTPEELLSQAKSSYDRGKDLFDNWQARRSNLRDAIRHLELSASYLEQFTPKPAIWSQARKMLEQAKLIRAQQMRSLSAEFTKSVQMRDFPRQREILLQIMDTSDLDSKNYSIAKRKLIQVDSLLRRIGKGK